MFFFARSQKRKKTKRNGKKRAVIATARK